MSNYGKWLYIAGLGCFLATAVPASGAEILASGSESRLPGPDMEPKVAKPVPHSPLPLPGNAANKDPLEINEAGEMEYVQKIRDWLNTLQPVQQARARQILREAHPGLHDLRKAIYDKKTELASISFDSRTAPDTLPRLGQELQLLRRALKAELEKVNMRLNNEAGVTMGPLAGEGFWLQPLPKNGSRLEPGRGILTGKDATSIVVSHSGY